ncbi:UDP-glucose 4-epimerase [Rubritalea halochordaticola]|uniref:UDP-glucose 4-epimerase n=1 Tax=Rubritalea halochordaticola TaxID=714537 RepID=A0ABP9V1X1_9BACT
MPDSVNTLVVGGAGYIGSHCVRQLQAAGHHPVVLDNLCYGHREAVASSVPFYQEDLGDYDAVCRILQDEKIELVMHFAAFTAVGESVVDPLKYYDNNVAKTISLFRAMEASGVSRFVFSSTAAVYGEPDECPIVETAAKKPINPYGQSKLDIENVLSWMCKSKGWSASVFRYFNAAGAAEDGRIGEDHTPENHLIPLAIKAAQGLRPALKVFGDDYPTEDGTCLRDYVHVDDISRAHIAVFERLMEPGNFLEYNLGTGTPSSVKQVIDTVSKASGLEVPYEMAARREGDPAVLYANSSKVQNELGWQPQVNDLESIIASAWKWHQSHPQGYTPS